jgi:hypothetical protein
MEPYMLPMARQFAKLPKAEWLPPMPDKLGLIPRLASQFLA